MQEQEPSGPNRETFGGYIRSIRLERGFSLEDVADATHIRIEVLMNIESEEMDRLLSPAYIKGFLRTISRAIGADGNKAVALFSQSLESRNENERALHPVRTQWPQRRLWWVAFALLCAVFASVYAYLQNFDDVPAGWRFWESTLQPEQQAVPANESGSATVTQDAHPQTAPKADVAAAENDLPKPQPQLLEVRATKDTWMKVIIDERPPVEYHLKPGDRLALEAAARYNLLIGNAAAAQLTLNGKPFPVSGRAGQTVTVQIP